jgi:hypothetical protein
MKNTKALLIRFGKAGISKDLAKMGMEYCFGFNTDEDIEDFIDINGTKSIQMIIDDTVDTLRDFGEIK